MMLTTSIILSLSSDDLFTSVLFDMFERADLSSFLKLWNFRCDERLKSKAKGSKRLAYTGLLGGLEHKR